MMALLPTGGVRWSKGECVCWRCGYDVSATSRGEPCPECGMVVDNAPYVLPRARAVWVVLCLLGMQIALVLFFFGALVSVADVRRGPTDLFALVVGVLAILSAWLTRAPAGAGIGLPWGVAALAAALCMLAAVADAALPLVVTLESNSLHWVLLGVMFVLVPATYAGVCWCMSWFLRRMQSPAQAARWCVVAVLWGLVSLALVLMQVSAWAMAFEMLMASGVLLLLLGAPAGVFLTVMSDIDFIGYHTSGKPPSKRTIG